MIEAADHAVNKTPAKKTGERVKPAAPIAGCELRRCLRTKTIVAKPLLRSNLPDRPWVPRTAWQCPHPLHAAGHADPRCRGRGLGGLEPFIVKWKQFCWLKRSRMIDRPARVVAKSTAKPAGRSDGPFQPTRRAGHLSARIRGDRLSRTSGYALRQSPLPCRKPAPAELIPFNNEGLQSCHHRTQFVLFA